MFFFCAAVSVALAWLVKVHGPEIIPMCMLGKAAVYPLYLYVWIVPVSYTHLLIPTIMLFEPGDPLKRSPGFVSFGRQRVYVSFEINNILSGMSSIDINKALIRIFI